MIHYHGLPITPMTTAVSAITAGHAFVSYASRDQLGVAVELCQSFAIDNGAYSAWKAGAPVQDWTPFYEWALECIQIPSCDFAVIPDVIGGTDEQNDALIESCPIPTFYAAPVWHMTSSLDRLACLVSAFPRVCISPAGYDVASSLFWRRMHAVMDAVCENGKPPAKLHGLRMLDVAVFSRLPFASADSTNIARNVNLDSRWTGSYTPPTKESRAAILRARIESHNAPARWEYLPLSAQADLF